MPARVTDLPGRQFGQMLEPMICDAVRKGELAKKLGTSPKNIDKWIAGDPIGAKQADKILTRLPYHWWDVWTEENSNADELALVRRVFEGDESLEMAA
jgi:hypothetical protein